MFPTQRRLQWETVFHRRPWRRWVHTCRSIAVRQGHRKSALKRWNVLPEFVVGSGGVSARQGSLKLFRLGDGLRFRSRILARVIVEQSRHGRGIGAHFFDWLGKPFIDRAVHQPVREPEHGNHGQERKQQAHHHQAGAEFRSRHALPPFGVELQQVAPEDDRQRHERKEDQAAQSGKKQKLFVAVGADELQIERGLRDQDRKQQKSTDGQPNYSLPTAGGPCFFTNWVRCGQG